MKRFSEEGKVEVGWLKKYCWGKWEKCVRFQMEERGEYHPDSMLPDGNVDEKLS
ncbi:uracil-DNA glycosylase [candidate division WOR-3 bacterium]|nr:uracil-DNA glycosylase [candidate division WOR-3 bacterium]